MYVYTYKKGKKTPSLQNRVLWRTACDRQLCRLCAVCGSIASSSRAAIAQIKASRAPNLGLGNESKDSATFQNRGLPNGLYDTQCFHIAFCFLRSQHRAQCILPKDLQQHSATKKPQQSSKTSKGSRPRFQVVLTSEISKPQTTEIARDCKILQDIASEFKSSQFLLGSSEGGIESQREMKAKASDS